MSTLRHSLQCYLDGEAAREELALLRPYQVAGCLGDDLAAFMLTLHMRGDQPTLLRRLKRYASVRDPGTHRRFERLTAPLFSQPSETPA